MSDMKSIYFPPPVADEMVRAILDGRKTVTRRVVKPPALYSIVEDIKGNCVCSYYEDEHGVYEYPTVDDCPYQPGDILYVKERVAYLFDRYAYRADYDEVSDDSRPFWKPSIHMPKEAARIFLRVTDVRVERLQEITEEQAVKEGCSSGCDAITGGPWGVEDDPEVWTARDDFSSLWGSTIKKADLPRCGWEANPWVWVIGFQRITREDAHS